MFSKPAANWYHSNQYNAEAVCEHCGGVIRHERWCITRDALVQYAFGVVLDAGKMTLSDRLILHALGVSWQADSSQCIAQSP